MGLRDEIVRYFEEKRDEVIRVLSDFVEAAPVNPRSGKGGKGEVEAAKRMEEYLRSWGFDVVHYDAEDPDYGARPNLMALVKGKDSSRKIWIIGHMDVVSPGDLSAWETDPHKAVVKDGKLFGRGAEDNGQGVVSGMFALRAIKELGLIPDYDVALLLVSDEEVGSDYGLKFLADLGLFSDADMAIVPDAGTPNGDFVEVAEKSLMWLRFTVLGKQVHASMPQEGRNARRAGAYLAVRLDRTLSEKFADRNTLFVPPYSTFELTKVEPNVDSVNIIPGRDVFYMDMRVLPSWNLDEILAAVRRIVTRVEKEFGVKVKVDVLQRVDAAPPTSPDAEIVKRIVRAIQLDRGFEPKVGGIGGGTVASILRAQGVDSVVWATIDEMAHQPNEYAKIDNILADARVFVLAALGEGMNAG